MMVVDGQKPGVSQGNEDLTSQCRQEYEGVVVGRLTAQEVMQEQNRLLMCWSIYYLGCDRLSQLCKGPG